MLRFSRFALAIIGIAIFAFSLQMMRSSRNPVSGQLYVYSRTGGESRLSDEGAIRKTQLTGPVDTLRSVRTFGGPTTFGWISDLLLLDSRLIVLDRFGEYRLIVMERTTGRVEISTGRAGRGPGEFLAPLSLDGPHGPDGALWVYDNVNALLTLFNIRSLSRGPERLLRLEPTAAQPTWFRDTIVANGLFAPELLRFYVPDGNAARLVARAGASPFPDAPPAVALSLNRNSLAADPSRRKIALAFLFVSRLHFYDSFGKLQVSVAGPTEVRPHFDVKTGSDEVARFVRREDTRWSYLDVAADEQHVYALFSGRSTREFGDAAYGANTVHVFSWRGELVRAIVLGEDVYRIALDRDSGVLFGARAMPYPSVVQFGRRVLLPSD
jgi:TolB-like 6-blade propeller-like